MMFPALDILVHQALSRCIHQTLLMTIVLQIPKTVWVISSFRNPKVCPEFSESLQFTKFQLNINHNKIIIRSCWTFKLEGKLASHIAPVKFFSEKVHLQLCSFVHYIQLHNEIHSFSIVFCLLLCHPLC